jgi:hypothetical protein
LGDFWTREERELTVVLFPVGISLGMRGAPTVRFENDALTFAGPMAVTQPLHHAIFLPMAIVSSFIGERYVDMPTKVVVSGSIFGLLLLLTFIYYQFYCGRLPPGTPLQIRAEDVSRVCCVGPFVRLRVQRSRLRGLSTV